MSIDIETRIRAFIDESFPAPDQADGIPGPASLQQSGIIDSIGVLSLVTYLEEEFAIRVEDEDVVPENLDSIDALVAFVGRKLQGV